MSRILILDNFFDNAEDLREFALSSRFFSHEEMSHKVGWRGFRTDELSGSSNYLIFRTCQKIYTPHFKFIAPALSSRLF